MKKSGRYDASTLVEAQFEPGSGGRVLRNVLGITRKREMVMRSGSNLDDRKDRGQILTFDIRRSPASLPPFENSRNVKMTLLSRLLNCANVQLSARSNDGSLEESVTVEDLEVALEQFREIAGG